MQLPILVESTQDGRFHAHIGEPFDVASDADSADRAVQGVVELVEKRLHAGAKIAVLTLKNGEVQASVSPFPADDAYKSDWVYQELAESIAENRRLEESVGP